MRGNEVVSEGGIEGKGGGVAEVAGVGANFLGMIPGSVFSSSISIGPESESSEGCPSGVSKVISSSFGASAIVQILVSAVF
jgi:hypothetical protein